MLLPFFFNELNEFVALFFWWEGFVSGKSGEDVVSGKSGEDVVRFRKGEPVLSEAMRLFGLAPWSILT
jgi:hypothetical protein